MNLLKEGILLLLPKKTFSMRQKIFLFCILISYTVLSQNQTPNDIITESINKTITIKMTSKSFNIKEQSTKINRFLTAKKLDASKDIVFFDDFHNLTKIWGETINTSDNKISTYPLTNITESDVLQNGIFFSGMKKKNVVFTNVQKNSVTKLNYEKKITDPHFIPASIITSNFPIKKYTLTVNFPDNVDLGYKVINPTDDLLFEKKTDGKHFKYQWTLTNISKTNRNYDFSALYYVPQIIIYIKSYTKKGVKHPILENVSDLYKWYSSLTCTTNTLNQEIIKKTTLSLIKGLKTEEEIIKKIYYFIQNQINYIAFEDGMNGFIPRDATKILKNKYGDCKDMANLLNEMLNYAGIKSYLTWIGSRRKPYSYKEVATPITDDHMITSVITKNDTLFLDATAKYLTYGYPSPFIQGKEALIGLSKDKFKIIKVPEVQAIKNNLSIENEFYIDKKSIIGKHKITLYGYQKLKTLHSLNNKESNIESLINDKLKIGKKATEFSNIEISKKALEQKNLNITCKSNSKGAVMPIGSKLYINPNFDDCFLSETVNNERQKFDKKIEFKSQTSFITKIKIPEGFTPEFIPENTQHKKASFSIENDYSIENNTIIIKKVIMINTLKIPVNSISEWNIFVKKLSKIKQNTIILAPNK